MYKILFPLFALLSCLPVFGQTDTIAPPPEDTIGYYDSMYYDTTGYIDDEYEYDESSYYGEGEELLNEEVDYDFSSDYGPNQKNFFQGYTYYGLIVGPSDTGVNLNYGSSYDVRLGWRYKRKLSGMFAVGTEMGLKSGEFNISQPHKNYFLDTTFWHQNDVIHRKEKVGYYAIDLGGFLRINFDPKRGNFLGHYIDLGATGCYVFSKRYVTVDELPESRLKSKFTKFPYVSPLQYDLTAKLGFNILAIVVKYRMSDFFKERYRFPEFARISVGLEISSLE